MVSSMMGESSLRGYLLEVTLAPVAPKQRVRPVRLADQDAAELVTDGSAIERDAVPLSRA
jgi:hypothetical protein